MKQRLVVWQMKRPGQRVKAGGLCAQNLNRLGVERDDLIILLGERAQLVEATGEILQRGAVVYKPIRRGADTFGNLAHPCNDMLQDSAGVVDLAHTVFDMGGGIGDQRLDLGCRVGGPHGQCPYL